MLIRDQVFGVTVSHIFVVIEFSSSGLYRFRGVGVQVKLVVYNFGQSKV